MNKIVDKIYEIEYGAMTKYYGDYEFFEKQKRINYEKQLKDFEFQQKEIKRLTDISDRFRYKPTKAKMALSKLKQAERMVKVEDEIVVRVGEKEHPMEKEHYIMWIAQVTVNKTIRVKLYPEQATETRFPYIPGATLYAYCNKHGLWKNVIK